MSVEVLKSVTVHKTVVLRLVVSCPAGGDGFANCRHDGALRFFNSRLAARTWEWTKCTGYVLSRGRPPVGMPKCR